MNSIAKAFAWRASPAAILLAGAILIAGHARADTSYLKPNFFTTANAELVTVQSSFTEDFANPNVALQSDQWHVLRPDGTKDTFDKIQAFTQVTILEADLKETGTYRLTTGERLGRAGQQVLVDGVWTPWAPGREIPAGAQTRASQTATVADVYVTKGAPTTKAVDARIGRVELKPVTHPNDVYLDTGFKLKVLFDGKPVPNQEVEIWRDGGAYDEPAYTRKIKSGADGGIEIKFDRPGAYLIWTRLSAPSPAGAQTPIRSYTTSLTLEVTR